MGSAIGDICEICGRESPSVDVKLWVQNHYRRKKLCQECIRTTRMLKTEGCLCDIEIYTKGEPESNYILTNDSIKDLYIKIGDRWLRR